MVAIIFSPTVVVQIYVHIVDQNIIGAPKMEIDFTALDLGHFQILFLRRNDISTAQGKKNIY